MAPWQRHPLNFIAEMSEIVAEDSKDSFWKYLENMCEYKSNIMETNNLVHDPKLTQTAETSVDVLQERIAELQDLALEATSTLIPAAMQSLFSTMISVGHYSPAIQFFETLAAVHTVHASKQCGSNNAFVVLYPGARIACSPDEIFHVDMANENVLSDDTVDETIGDAAAAKSWDHVFEVGADNGQRGETRPLAKKAVLYGLFGSPSYCELHSALASATSAGLLAQYSARHHFPTTAALPASSALQGYGVLLDIKNMEYKNVDDSATTSAPPSAASGPTAEAQRAADWESLGVDFDKLLAHVPSSSHPDHSKEQLTGMMREQLVQTQEQSSGEGSSTMKVWKMQDLGLQTLQLVRTAATQGTPVQAMSRLQELVHNFPRLASMVSATKVSASLKEEVHTWYQATSGQGMLLPPNSILVNGRRIDLSASTFNTFDLLDEIRAELVVTSALSALNLSAATKEQVGRIASSVGGTSGPMQPGRKQKQVRIDVSKGAKHVVNFLNNLEKDPQYQHLPRGLKHLLQPSWSLTALSRNLYTLIVVADPLSHEGAGLLMQMYMVMQQQYPVRCGMVFACTAAGASSQDGTSSSQEDFCRLFAQIKSRHSMEHATSFALSVAQTVLEGAVSDFDREQLRAMYVGTVEAIADSVPSGSWVSSGGNNAAAIARKQAGVEVDEVFSLTSNYKLHGDFVGNSSAYLAARNLPINSFSLNGIVTSGAEEGGANLGGALMQLLAMEQRHLTDLFRKKVITDKTKSLFSAVLSHAGAYSRYHPLLEESAPSYVSLGDALLREVAFVEPDSTGSSVYGTTVLYLPVSEQGLAAAATALRWATGSISSSTEVSLAQRVGIVWQLSDPTSPAAEAALSLLARLQHSLSLHSTPEGASGSTAAVRCDILCALVMEKAYLAMNVDSTVDTKLRDIAVISAVRTALSSAELVAVASAERLQQASSAAKAFDAALRDPSAQALWNSIRSAARLAEDSLVDGDQQAPASIVVVHGGRKLVIPSTVASADSAELVPAGLFAEDLVLLSTIEADRITEALVPVVLSSGRDKDASDLLLKLASYCGSYNSRSGKHRVDVTGALDQIAALHGSLSGGGSANDFASAMVYTVEPPLSDLSGVGPVSDIQVCVVVDPLTLAGQRAAALIPLLTEQLQYTVTVVLVPRLEITDFPLQNFYRFVTAGTLSNPAAKFTALPRQHTLTVRLDIPEPWNVQASAAQQDIDNLRCSSTQCGDPGNSQETTLVTYVLRNLLVAGQCFEVSSADSPVSRYAAPPNGLQLTLTPAHLHSREGAAGEAYADTLVMQNLGYFQLQANPGLFVLGTAQGRASQLYALQQQGQTGVDAVTGVKYLAVRSFGDVVQRLIVHKRPGMEHLSLLGDDTDEGDDMGSTSSGQRPRGPHAASLKALAKKKQLEAAAQAKAKEGGLWNTLSSTLFGKGGTAQGVQHGEVVVGGAGEMEAATVREAVGSAEEDGEEEAEQEDDRIHVFSLATGHMYERLLRIMMLSVSRHTSKPVKFWLFENYLSPTFKHSAALMAQEFGFEVGYVTYKWPQWLTQQTQQQRIIWGYKILFLDVLFPLNVKKVIYVDADQVVRADLKELWDLDLQGHAYAYTPFCTSRQETLGFQFWHQGYWKEHLRGRPYHISALYVVDLQRFRRNAVGDSLRAIYDQLSRDPNSLANLDQDLPNYAQHQVPIFSLPQEWLWCESWCSDDSKSEAKTIDLCNNPLHKEPKLDMARRVVSGPLFNQSWVQLDEEIRTLQLRAGVALS